MGDVPRAEQRSVLAVEELRDHAGDLRQLLPEVGIEEHLVGPQLHVALAVLVSGDPQLLAGLVLVARGHEHHRQHPAWSHVRGSGLELLLEHGRGRLQRLLVVRGRGHGQHALQPQPLGRDEGIELVLGGARPVLLQARLCAREVTVGEGQHALGQRGSRCPLDDRSYGLARRLVPTSELGPQVGQRQGPCRERRRMLGGDVVDALLEDLDRKLDLGRRALEEVFVGRLERVRSRASILDDLERHPHQ